MSDEQENSMLKEAEASLKRIQDFDSSQLPREIELGTDLNFTGAVEPANRLISFYKLISPTILPELSDDRLGKLRARADADFSIFNGVLTFKGGEPVETRNS